MVCSVTSLWLWLWLCGHCQVSAASDDRAELQLRQRKDRHHPRLPRRLGLSVGNEAFSRAAGERTSLRLKTQRAVTTEQNRVTFYCPLCLLVSASENITHSHVAAEVSAAGGGGSFAGGLHLLLSIKTKKMCQILKFPEPLWFKHSTQWLGEMTSVGFRAKQTRPDSYSLKAFRISYFMGLSPWSSGVCVHVLLKATSGRHCTRSPLKEAE